eukprot:70853-Chlamydomonas_euryale.AAC.8
MSATRPRASRKSRNVRDLRIKDSNKARLRTHAFWPAPLSREGKQAVGADPNRRMFPSYRRTMNHWRGAIW